MIYDIVAADLKYYIDASGIAEELTPEKSIFQISVGPKKDKYGWHYILNDGSCQFKRGLYTGGIFIDWNDEYKYKQKSKKQIKLETTPDYEIIFKNEQELETFVEGSIKYISGVSDKKPKIRSDKLSGSKCRCEAFNEAFIESSGMMSDNIVRSGDGNKIKVASNMALYNLAEAFNYLLKQGDETLAHFASGSRRSYFFGIEGEDPVWITTQDGLGKVTANQGTKLPPLCGLEFSETNDAIKFVYGDAGIDIFDRAFVYKGAAIYGAGLDEKSIRDSFYECCKTAVKTLK